MNFSIGKDYQFEGLQNLGAIEQKQTADHDDLFVDASTSDYLNFSYETTTSIGKPQYEASVSGFAETIMEEAYEVLEKLDSDQWTKADMESLISEMERAQNGEQSNLAEGIKYIALLDKNHTAASLAWFINDRANSFLDRQGNSRNSQYYGFRNHSGCFPFFTNLHHQEQVLNNHRQKTNTSLSEQTLTNLFEISENTTLTSHERTFGSSGSFLISEAQEFLSRLDNSKLWSAADADRFIMDFLDDQAGKQVNLMDGLRLLAQQDPELTPENLSQKITAKLATYRRNYSLFNRNHQNFLPEILRLTDAGEAADFTAAQTILNRVQQNLAKVTQPVLTEALAKPPRLTASNATDSAQFEMSFASEGRTIANNLKNWQSWSVFDTQDLINAFNEVDHDGDNKTVDQLRYYIKNDDEVTAHSLAEIINLNIAKSTNRNQYRLTAFRSRRFFQRNQVDPEKQQMLNEHREALNTTLSVESLQRILSQEPDHLFAQPAPRWTPDAYGDDQSLSFLENV